MFLLSQILRLRVLGDSSTRKELAALLKTNSGPSGADQCGLTDVWAKTMILHLIPWTAQDDRRPTMETCQGKQ